MMSNNHIPVSHQNGICETETQLHYSNERKLFLFELTLQYVMCGLHYLYFIVMEEFQLQIRNTVSSMKYDLDLITNRVVQIELKLNEVK